MKHVVRQIFTLIVVGMALSCNNEKKEPDVLISGTRKPGSYSFDKRFLLQQDTGLIELKAGKSAVIVSARYQAKVFTSTADIDENNSFGWINYKAFSTKYDRHMNAYGGENRLWLGPEGGRYSLFFRKGDSMTFDNWRTPPEFDIEAWQVVKKNPTSVTMRKNMSLLNYLGVTLNLNVERTVVIQEREDVKKLFDLELSDSVKLAGYSTINTITNTGKFVWTDSTGVPCIWILDMFNPSHSTNIIIPFKPAGNINEVATTDYFGEIDDDRLRIDSNVVFFKADGRKRGKIGIQPEYARAVAGSYDAKDKLLTVTYFTIDSAGRYLNQEWNTTDDVYSGDAVNAYNDGPLADGSQMGPFYELESVSPAALLKPGEKLEHVHNVYHFTGNLNELDRIARKIFGRKLADIQNAFR